MQEKLVIWGASGHARVVADIARLDERYDLVGFLDDTQPEKGEKTYLGLPVWHTREDLERLCEKGVRNLFIGVGDNRARLRLAQWGQEQGFTFPALVHPRAVVAADVSLGEGAMVAACAVINPGSEVEPFAIINTSSSVDHDCHVGRGVHVGPGARLAGWVTVLEAAFIGVGCSVLPHVTIGAYAQIGAGAVVVRDVQDGVLAYGVPARIPQKRHD